MYEMTDDKLRFKEKLENPSDCHSSDLTINIESLYDLHVLDKRPLKTSNITETHAKDRGVERPVYLKRPLCGSEVLVLTVLEKWERL